MRHKDKPFVLYRFGPMSFYIIPRGFAGWAQFVVWLALPVPLVLWLAEHLGRDTGAVELGSALFVFLIGMAAWLIGGWWWMASRAETVDPFVAKRDKQMRERKQLRDREEQRARRTSRRR